MAAILRWIKKECSRLGTAVLLITLSQGKKYKAYESALFKSIQVFK